jgi:hypothetical protein
MPDKRLYHFFNGWPRAMVLPRLPFAWRWRSTIYCSFCGVSQHFGEGIPDTMATTALLCGHVEAFATRMPDRFDV